VQKNMHIVTTKFPAYATRLGSGAESMVCV